MFGGACSSEGRWRSPRVGWSRTHPSPWGGTGATAHGWSRWCRVAGAGRIGNDDLDREPLGQPRVLRPLCAPIIGQGFAQQRGPVPECRGEAGSRPRLAPVPSLLARLTTRVVRATRVPTAAPLRAPWMRSPCQWPGTVRVATAAGRPAGPRPTRLAQRHQQCAPQGSAWQHIQADREGLSRQVVAPVVRIRAGEPPGTLFGRAPLGQMRPHRRPQPEIQECARAVAGAPDRLPTCVPCTRETGGPVLRCGRIPGARCWALAAPPSPAPAANGQGPGPDAAAHGRRHASA